MKGDMKKDDQRRLSLVARKFESEAKGAAEAEGIDCDENGTSKNFTYLILFQQALEELACDNYLTRSILRVLLYMFGKIGYENKINKSQVQIAQALKMQQSQVSKAIKYLIEKDIIVHHAEERIFYLNQKIAWRGSIENYDEYVKKEKFKLIQMANLGNKELDKQFFERTLNREQKVTAKDINL